MGYLSMMLSISVSMVWCIFSFSSWLCPMNCRCGMCMTEPTFLSASVRQNSASGFLAFRFHEPPFASRYFAQK